MTDEGKLPGYLQDAPQNGHIYGTLSYNRRSKCWTIKGEPCVTEMATRLFPGSERRRGEARFTANRRIIGDVNWLMLRYPLEIAPRDRALWEHALEQAREFYDFILIDCPPTLDMLTINALVAANSVIVPLQCEFLSLEGLVELNNTIERVKKNFNEGLHYEGILFTMYVERYKVTGQIVKEVKKYFPKQVFETVIPRNIALSEAPSFGMPALYYDKKSKGSKAYEALAKEILKNEKKRRE